MQILDTLNEPQRQAVCHTEGPLLILAGAGSGKTRVLTHRIAWLMQEEGVNPWHILAITFTNKAAGEMRERVDKIAGFGAESVWVSTFHSMCVRILRRYIDRIGYDTNFTIYDADDQKTLMKEVCKYLGINTKQFRERTLLARISAAKDEMITPEQFRLEAEGDFSAKKVAEVYEEYEKRLRANNALDFDDLLMKTVQLLQTDREVRESYQERFRYIMVDEYQDTNTVQFILVSLLAGKYRNLCVVGDDDQSIYKFRGANIKNILNFEQEFPDAAVIKLEQNYRSTSTILDAANAVIRNNKGRKEKSLWTDKGKGEAIAFRQFEYAAEEAEYIACDIKKEVEERGRSYRDCAVLYRTNAQSRMLEEQLVAADIPYRIFGGINFYARREIKDLLCYLKTMDNGRDDLAVRRIINVPKRGIGLTTVNRLQEYALNHEISLYEAVLSADKVPGIGRGLARIESFAALMENLKAESQRITLAELLDLIVEKTGYEEELEALSETEEDLKGRKENIEELRNKMVAYDEQCKKLGQPSALSEFLEEIALVADIDNLDESMDYVALMTLHSAKGLEFPHIYLAGMEDGLFPSYMTITSDSPEDLEEERRLCYVGITRAQEDLTMTCARRRMVHGETQFNRMSRFLSEIPLELLATGAAFQKSSVSSAETEEKKPGAYTQARQAFRAKAFQAVRPSQNFGSAAAEGPGYQEGDRVRHIKFGDGTVTQMVKGGRDFEVTVEFDTAGVKKMFAMFAKLQKIE